MQRRLRTGPSAALAALGVVALGPAGAAAQEPVAPVEPTGTTTQPLEATPTTPEPAETPSSVVPTATTTPTPEPPPPTPPPPPAPEPPPLPQVVPATPAPAPEAAATPEAEAAPEADAAPTTQTAEPDAPEARKPKRPRRPKRPKAGRDRDRAAPQAPAADDEAPVRPRRPKAPAAQPSALPPVTQPMASTPVGSPGADPLRRAAPSALRAAVLERFRIPPFLLPIYQAAGTQYGIRWEILAAINEIETDFGRNLAVSSAGAQGWMQFMPATWKAYGTDANRDGERDPWNPVDAIFAAARYLKASGAQQDLRKAIWAYNHADWYVNDVLERAARIAELPTELVDGLTGLTQGRHPVLGTSRVDRLRATPTGDLEPSTGRRGAIVFTEPAAPVIAVQDGRVVAMGRTPRLGRFLVLEDAFGNRYTYARLSEVARTYAAPKAGAKARRGAVRTPVRTAEPAPAATAAPAVAVRVPGTGSRGAEPLPGKERLFAHPERAAAEVATAVAEAPAPVAPQVDVTAYERELLGGLRADQVAHRELRVGSEVIGGTVLGRAGKSTRTGKDLLRFEVRPGGEHAPRIDPAPILDGLELVRDSGMERRLASAKDTGAGQVLLLSKSALIRRVLGDERIVVGGCGRQDIAAGVIDRRVLASLAFLADSGMAPTVTSLRCDHGTYTASGNVSHHSTGTAVDIGSINGVRIQPSTQGPGSITDRAVRRLLQLQGSSAPAQIITLQAYEGAPNTLAMADHDDHIHLGFRPGGDSTARRSATVRELRPSQWKMVADRLGRVENPRLREATRP